MRLRGISMRQGGISGALHTSPSRLDHRAPLEHSRSDCLSQHTACIGWRQLQGLETELILGPLESIQCGVIKECRDCGFGSCTLINVVKQRKVCMFLGHMLKGCSSSAIDSPYSKHVLARLCRKCWLSSSCKSEYITQKLN